MRDHAKTQAARPGVAALALALLALLAFAPGALAAPAVTTNPATVVHHTSAVLNGHLDPSGDPGVTECHFDWGATTSYSGGTVPCAQGNTFSSAADVSATLGFLEDGTEYHFRLTATTTSSGVIHGADQSFITPGFPVFHTELGAFGPDGTSGTSFDGNRFGSLALRQGTDHLYALNASYGSSGGIYGFNASSPPAYPPLTGTNPIPIGGVGNNQTLAVDSTSGPFAGNLYYVEEQGSSLLIDGFDSSGAPLGGNFPIDPTVNPGGAAGSPVDVGSLGVDSEGNLWVANRRTDSMLRYSSSGVFQGSVDLSAYVPAINGPNYDGPYRIAFDVNDNLYVSSSFASHGEEEGVWKFTAGSGYTVATKVYEQSVDAIAVDPSNQHLFLAPRLAILDNEGNLSQEVREYDPAGNLLSEFARNLPSSGGGIAGLAVDGANHYVYVTTLVFTGSWISKIHVFDPGVTQELPSVSSEPADAIDGASATLHAKVDPETHPVTDCHFDWGLTSAYGNTAPCNVDPGSGSGDVAVAADLTGLNGGTTYHFRIVASNATGTVKGSDGIFTTLGPRLKDSSIDPDSTASDGASVRATINPQGEATSFHVEYGTTTAYGSSTAEKALGAVDSLDHATEQALSGLAPNTSYHLRVVASNASGTVIGPDLNFATYGDVPSFASCANDALRSGASAKLPDCRAYEQASPVDKDGSDATGTAVTAYASTSGDAVAYNVIGGAPGADSSSGLPTFVARRGASNWSTQGTFPPASLADRAFVDDWTPDLAHVFTSAHSVSAENPGYAFVDKDTAAGTYTVVYPYLAKEFALAHLVGASADYSKVYFTNPLAKVTEDAAADVSNLYLWDRGSEAISLAGQIPAEPDSECGGEGPACEVPAGGSYVGVDVSGEFTGLSQPEHAVSSSGEQVIFNAGSPSQLYARLGVAGAEPSTVRVSAAQAGVSDPNGTKPALFQYATPSGSKVFFTSPQKLTDDANTGPSDAGADLYVWDSASRQLADLTPDTANPDGADVIGVIGASDAGDYVYFVANGDLDEAGEATAGNCVRTASYDAVKGRCNLYLWHSGEAHPTFIARLDAGNGPSQGDIANWELAEKPSCACDSERLKTGRVSADGHALLFRSTQRLTAYDNQGKEEFYRYSLADGLDCVSCNPTGAAPTEGATISSVYPPSSAPKVQIEGYPNIFSTDGSRAFFETPDKLVAADTDGLRDVYEWEAPGAGSCKAGQPPYSSSNGGCMYLISTSTGTGPSLLAGASTSGNDVFFFTRESLVPQDTDQLIDVYDARAGGGLAAQHAVPPPPCDANAGACEGAGTSAANQPGAATAAIVGQGNPPIDRGCPKGKVRRHGRCVAKPKPQRKRHRHHRANDNRRTHR